MSMVTVDQSMLYTICVLFCWNAKCRYAECRRTNLTSADKEVERHCDQLVLTRWYMYWTALNKLLRSSKQQFYGKFELELQSVNDQGILKGEVSLFCWPLFDWFGISCMTTFNFCYYWKNRLIQTSQTGVPQ